MNQKKSTVWGKLFSLDKSWYYSRTISEYTVKPLNRTRSISSANWDEKDTKLQLSKEIMVRNNKSISDNWSVSSMYVHGESITTILLDRDRIPRKNIQNKL